MERWRDSGSSVDDREGGQRTMDDGVRDGICAVETTGMTEGTVAIETRDGEMDGSWRGARGWEESDLLRM
jgi:hypothetical protein